jgi:hypothetical protein
LGVRVGRTRSVPSVGAPAGSGSKRDIRSRWSAIARPWNIRSTAGFANRTRPSLSKTRTASGTASRTDRSSASEPDADSTGDAAERGVNRRVGSLLRCASWVCIRAFGSSFA